MKSIFHDKSLNDQFDEKGYVVVDMLDAIQVDTLLKLYKDVIMPEKVSGLYESSRHNSLELNQLINQSIYKEIAHSSSDLFSEVDLYGGTFMVKSTKDSEMLPLHQDWSVVEEDKFNTVFIWCPLMNVEPENGGLFVLEGSHKYFDNLRSGTYPSNRYPLPVQMHFLTKNISLKAGQAILYSDKLFHGSYANNSLKDRVVVTARVIESGGQLVYFNKLNENEVEVFEASPEFYLNYIDLIAKGEMPAGITRVYKKPYRHQEISDELLQLKIREKYSELLSKNTEMKCELFQDPQVQDAFEEDGYVVLDLIDSGQVQDLLDFYKSLNNEPVPGYGFQVSLDNRDPEFVHSVFDKLVNTVRTNIGKHFKDHQIFTASFVVKEKNPLGVVPPHQDWTFVDEQNYWSATVWCPLVDVHIDNGALGVIRGSHRFYDHVRPSPSPQYSPPFSHQLEIIFPYLKTIELKAGQALVFNNQTIHGSPPNATDETRVSFGIGITHKDAAIRHNYLLPGTVNMLEGYEVDPEFFFCYNNARLSAMFARGEKPSDIRSIGNFAYTFRNYDDQTLSKMIEAAGNTKNLELVSKMTAIFTGYSKSNSNPDKIQVKKTLPLWKVYTPGNIMRELKYRLSRSGSHK